MKIVRFGEPRQEKPGIIDSENNIRDLSGAVTDITGEFLEVGGLSKIAQLDINSLPVASGSPRLGIPVAGVP